MPFFPASSCFVISGGTFTNVNPPTRDAGRSSSRNSHGLMIVQADEVDLHREIFSGKRYRIYSAFHGERFVAVKTFEGPHANQDWATDIALSRKVFHPNVLKIGGVSDEHSESHFVLFHGITSEQKMQSLIAKALRTDLDTSVQLSMKAVKGIAAGLSYVKSKNILMHAGRLNFDIFIGHENEPVISFHPSTTADDDGSISQNFDIETGDRGIEALNRLCQQLFSGANSILYDDSPERKFDIYDREGHPTATLEDTEGTSNLSASEAILNPSTSTEKSKSCPIPRREVWWLDLGAKNQCLESIKQCFEDCLDRFPISSSNSLLRRIRSPKDHSLRRNLHQCPGYLREEITLTSDVSRSAIVSHAFPSQSELCSICGQLVQHAYVDPSIIDEEMDWGEDGPLDFPAFDDEGTQDMDFGVSPSVSPLSSARSDMLEEAEEPTELEMDSVNEQVPPGVTIIKAFDFGPAGTKALSNDRGTWICSLCALSNPSSTFNCQTCNTPDTSTSSSGAVAPLPASPPALPADPALSPTSALTSPSPSPTPHSTSSSAQSPLSRFDSMHSRTASMSSRPSTLATPVSPTRSHTPAPMLPRSYTPASAPARSHTPAPMPPQSQMPAPMPPQHTPTFPSPSTRSYTPAPPVPVLPRFSIPAPTSMTRAQTVAPPKPRRLCQPSPPRVMRSTSEEKEEAHERWLPPSYHEGDYYYPQSNKSSRPSSTPAPAPARSHTPAPMSARSHTPAPVPPRSHATSFPSPFTRSYTPAPPVPVLPRFSIPAPTSMTRAQTVALPNPRRLCQPSPPKVMRSTSEEKEEAHERWLPPSYHEGDYDYPQSNKSSRPPSTPAPAPARSHIPAPMSARSHTPAPMPPRPLAPRLRSPSIRSYTPAPPVPTLPRFSTPAPTNMTHEVQTPAPLVVPKPRRLRQPSPPRMMRSTSDEKAEAHERWLPPSSPEGDYDYNQSIKLKSSRPPSRTASYSITSRLRDY